MYRYIAYEQVKTYEERYRCIKEIAKALRTTYKGIQSNSYGFCCNSDYDYYHKYTNNDDYVCAKIYKGGLNNNYDYTEKMFVIDRSVYWSWQLKTWTLEEVSNTMQEIASNYGARILVPDSASYCIELEFPKSDYERKYERK